MVCSILISVVENYRLGSFDNINILGVSVVAVMFGVAVASLKQPRPLLDVVQVVFDAIMAILNVMLWYVVHLNGHVVILTKLSSLAPLEVDFYDYLIR